jgi:hypothetical protein
MIVFREDRQAAERSTPVPARLGYRAEPTVMQAAPQTPSGGPSLAPRTIVNGKAHELLREALELQARKQAAAAVDPAAASVALTPPRLQDRTLPPARASAAPRASKASSAELPGKAAARAPVPAQIPAADLFARPPAAAAAEEVVPFLRRVFLFAEVRVWVVFCVLVLVGLAGQSGARRFAARAPMPKRDLPSLARPTTPQPMSSGAPLIHFIPTPPRSSKAALLYNEAANALAQGQYGKALDHYRLLARQPSGDPAFAAIARVVEQKIAAACRGVLAPDGTCEGR